VYHSIKGDISNTFPRPIRPVHYNINSIHSLIRTNLPIYSEVTFCISNLLFKVEHLIIGLSFKISVTQGKCPLNVTCPGVWNVHDMWNFWYLKEISSKCHISFSLKCTWHAKFLILMEMPRKCHMSLSREIYRTHEISHGLKKFHMFLVNVHKMWNFQRCQEMY